MELYQYWCARGTTSLENFHLHVKDFFPGRYLCQNVLIVILCIFLKGFLASGPDLHAFLMGSVARWNVDHGLSTRRDPVSCRSYSSRLLKATNVAAELTTGKPPKYSGELVGLDYLLDQVGSPLDSFWIAKNNVVNRAILTMRQ